MNDDTFQTSLEKTDKLIDWLRSYAAIRINSQVIDDRRTMPPNVILDFGRHGLFGLQAPILYGGLGLTQTDTMRVLEQLSAIDLTLATFVSSHAIGMYAIQHHGSPSLRALYLQDLATGRMLSAFGMTEPGAGSNPRAMSSTAVSDGCGGWILSGSKSYVDSGAWAGVFTVLAKTSDRHGTAEGISAFAMAQGVLGLAIGGEAPTLGLRGMVQNTISMHEVRLTSDCLLGSIGEGIAISQRALSIARLNLAAKSLGAIKRCLQVLYRFASRRPIATGLLWDNAVTQSRAVRLSHAAVVIESLLYAVGRRIDSGKEVPQEAFLACKIAASEYLWYAVNVVTQALGARGYDESNQVARMLRDARSFLVSEGPSEVLLTYLGSQLIHASPELVRFIADDLGSPEIAARLLDVAQDLNVRCAARDLDGASVGSPGEWAAYRAGGIGVSGILHAAAQCDDTGLNATARRWAELEFDQRVIDASRESAADWAIHQIGDVEAIITEFSKSIGDIEQSLPGLNTDLDPLLRQNTIVSAAAGVRAPTVGTEQSMLSPHEEQRQLVDWNATARPYEQGAYVHQLVERQARSTPYKVAVICGDDSLSYEQLDSRATRLAAELQAAGVEPGAVVGVCVERSLELLISLLGVLKAGGAYLPLDPHMPRLRIKQIIDESGIQLIISDPDAAERLPAAGKVFISPNAGMGTRLVPLPAPAMGDEPAYVLYTSGSTGSPKGVVITHRSVVNLLTSIQRCPGITANDTLLAVTPVYFDISVLELFCPLIVGGCVVIATPGLSLDALALASELDAKNITVLQATPATWRALISAGWEGRPQMRALCGGEALPLDLARELCGRTASLWNLYGPTETTVWSTVGVVLIDEGLVTVGRPIDNTVVYLLDASSKPVQVGTSAEIYIGGDGVALGYLAQPGLTSERFLQDPFRPGRMYRTGDLGRYRSDGRIEHLGRLDQQVKIRGFRVELGEIEVALNSHESILDSVVEAVTGPFEEARLSAYVIRAPGIEEAGLGAELRRHLAERVPPYMMPAVFYSVPRFPLTPNGKVNRKALRNSSGLTALDLSNAELPTSPLEAELVELWCRLLRIKAAGCTDDFFALGGHSLLATQLVAQVRRHYNVDIAIASFFDHPTITALAKAIGGDSQSDARMAQPDLDSLPMAHRSDSTITPRDSAALADGQFGLFFLERMGGLDGAYNESALIQLRGRLDARALEWSLQRLIDRHEALRYGFVERDGRATRIVHPELVLRLQRVDAPVEQGAAADDHGMTALRQEVRRAFDLSQPPLIRALLQSSEDEHLLLIVVHHIVCDAWSMNLICRDIADAYRAALRQTPWAPPGLPAQYSKHVELQSKMASQPPFMRSLDYWTERLKGSTVLKWPRLRADARTGPNRGSRLAIHLDAEQLIALRRLAQAHRCTLFMVLLGALQTLLVRYTGQEDISIGVPVAGRDDPDLSELVGLFVNTVVVRTDLSGNPSFIELLARIRQGFLADIEHRQVPLDKVVAALSPQRRLETNPLFQVSLSLQNIPSATLDFGDLNAERAMFDPGTSKFDLSLSLVESGNLLAGTFEYRTDLLDADAASRLIGHFTQILAAVARNPQCRINSMPLITNSERRKILVEWNDTYRPLRLEWNLHQHFEDQVRLQPDAIAVRDELQSLTYAQLNRASNRLAHSLRAKGIQPGVCAGIFLERGSEMIVAMLAVLKAGGSYVPLDPEYPAQRIALMVAETAAQVVLTHTTLREKLSASGSDSICVDSHPYSSKEGADKNLKAFATSGDLAFILFTSGSSGVPKGVCIDHRAVLRLVTNTDCLQVKAADCVAQAANTSFDAATFEIWGALTNGARLEILSKDAVLDSDRLNQQIRDREITTLFLTTSIFNVHAHRSPFVFSQLKYLLIGGEACSAEAVRRVFAAAPPRHLFNVYGPTEATTFATSYEVAMPPDVLSGTDPVPIGRPISNTVCYVLDETMQPVPIGVPGELYLGGYGLAREYLNRPSLTAERFVASPFCEGERLYRTGDRVRYLPDGNLDYLARMDQQIKLRGYRIEPGEIEAALCRESDVSQCAVVLSEDPAGDKRLVAYVVPQEDVERPSARELKTRLALHLPQYLLPSIIHFVDEIPLTLNGKLDRGALQTLNLVEKSPVIGPAGDDVELQLQTIWEDLLDVRPCGLNENFFEIGGHSVLALRLVSAIERRFDRGFDLTSIFKAPTIRQQALLLRDAHSEAGTSCVAVQPRGSHHPLFFVPGFLGSVLQFKPLAEALGEEQPLYILDPLTIATQLDDQVTLPAIAARMIVDLQAIQPIGPYHLAGYSVGGYVAYEMAQLLIRDCNEVGSLVLLDCPAPGYPRRRAFVFRTLLHLKHAFALSPKQMVAYVTDRALALSKYLRPVESRSLTREFLRRTTGLTRAMERSSLMLSTASDSYRPAYYSGRISIVRASVARDRPGVIDNDRCLGWLPFAGLGVGVCDLACKHENMLETEFAPALGVLLTSFRS